MSVQYGMSIVIDSYHIRKLQRGRVKNTEGDSLFATVHGSFGYGTSNVNDHAHFRAGREGSREQPSAFLCALLACLVSMTLVVLRQVEEEEVGDIEKGLR